MTLWHIQKVERPSPLSSSGTDFLSSVAGWMANRPGHSQKAVELGLPQDKPEKKIEDTKQKLLRLFLLVRVKQKFEVTKSERNRPNKF